VVKYQHCAEKWTHAEKRSVDFLDTVEKWANTTQQHYAQAHSKHSKRSYALFLRFANSSAAEQHYKQRIGRFKAFNACGILTTTTHKAAVNTYEQEIRKNCSNAVGR
jgi:hypothetical protein